MKRKLEEQRKEEAEEAALMIPHDECWEEEDAHNLKLHESSSSSSSPQKPQRPLLPIIDPQRSRTRSVSPDFRPPSSQQSRKPLKSVRFSNNPLILEQIHEIVSATTLVPKSLLFYSRHDYMKFYVRERSRLAFQDLTRRICQEQERRILSGRRVIPQYFVALNFWNAIATINELGMQVKQQQKRRRRYSSSSSNIMHLASLNTNNQVTPRPPRRNTVCASVA